MPDNWSFVVAAYVVTVVVLELYWRSLNRRERDAVPRRVASRQRRPGPGSSRTESRPEATVTTSASSPPRS